MSLRVKRSNLAFFEEIATHLSGARNDSYQAIDLLIAGFGHILAAMS